MHECTISTGADNPVLYQIRGPSFFSSFLEVFTVFSLFLEVQNVSVCIRASQDCHYNEVNDYYYFLCLLGGSLLHVFSP